MKDPSVPLLIGSNDLSAYKMTTFPYAHTLIVGDFLRKNESIEFSGLMPYQDWNVPLKVFQDQQATVNEIENLMKTTIKRLKKPTKLKRSRPQYKIQLKLDLAKMNKAQEPEKKLYSSEEAAETVNHLLNMHMAAIKEYDDNLIRIWNFIDPTTTTAANFNISELQSTRTSPHSTEEFTEDEVAGTVSLWVACRCIEYLMHERDNEKVQTSKWNWDHQPNDPEVSVNSSQASFAGIDPSHYDFDHIVSDRGYYDKDDFIQTRSANVNTLDEEFNKYSVIDSSQLYFTDHHEHQFTLPPDPIQRRSEAISKTATPKMSPNQIISGEQIEWLNDHIFKPGYLAFIQPAELKELEESPERLAELKADL